MVRAKWQPREIFLGIGIFAAIILILTFYVWHQTEAVRLGLKIRDCEDRIKSVREDIQKLEIKKASLLSPQRVEKIARESLGLADPADQDVSYEGRTEKH